MRLLALSILFSCTLLTPYSLAKSYGLSNPDSYDVTGIVVPHHAVAFDLIEETFRCAANQEYKRIIILSPDHFRRSKTPFATTLEDFYLQLVSYSVYSFDLEV